MIDVKKHVPDVSNAVPVSQSSADRFKRQYMEDSGVSGGSSAGVRMNNNRKRANKCPPGPRGPPGEPGLPGGLSNMSKKTSFCDCRVFLRSSKKRKHYETING